MKPCTNSPVKDDNDSNDKVPKSYRWKSLSPEKLVSTPFIQYSTNKEVTRTSSVQWRAWNLPAHRRGRLQRRLSSTRRSSK